MFRVVIPARYASARLPGKALLTIAGKPMIQWVYERACASRAQQVLIATDDLLIVSAAHSFGAETVMTAATHKSGTDRIAEVARLQGWAESGIVVNVQGDEPVIPPALIDQVASVLESNPSAQIATLATPVTSISEFMDPNAVKVVTDEQGRALYFSRAPIPWDRDGAAFGLVSQRSFAGARRHVGSMVTAWAVCCDWRRSNRLHSSSARNSSNCVHWKMDSRSELPTASSSLDLTSTLPQTWSE
jgi:3-deoxy-manno-octulosonate cytidylyltransferase (CMP-KDO synthetase)